MAKGATKSRKRSPEPDTESTAPSRKKGKKETEGARVHQQASTQSVASRSSAARSDSSSASVKRSTPKSVVKAKAPVKKSHTRSKAAEPDLTNDGLELVEPVGSDDEERAHAKGSDTSEPEPEEDPEAQLTRLQRRWDSPIYAFFEPAYVDHPAPTHRLAHAFRCSARGCKRIIYRFVGTSDASSTGNLSRHAKSCFGEDAVAAAREAKNKDEVRTKIVASFNKNGTITSAFERKKGGVTYSHRPFTRIETRTEIVKWVAEDLRPFRIVKDRGFLVLMKTGRPGYYVPSPSTVARDVKVVFARTRRRVARFLRRYPGRLNFATDAWSSSNHRAFVAFLCFLEHNGTLFVIVLDMRELPIAHTGANLAREFVDCLTEFRIQEKILGVTCDNASNNDTMLAKMMDLLPNFSGELARVRCFAHVLNLVAKSLISEFDARVERNEDEVDEEELRELRALTEGEEEEEVVTRTESAATAGNDDDGEVAVGDDNVDDEVDPMAQLTPQERAQFEIDVRPVKLILAKLRKLSFKIIHSTTRLLPEWKSVLRTLRLPEKLLPRDVKTRWNSTYEMLRVAIEYRAAVDMLCANKSNGLRSFELTPQEWKTAKQLRHVLKVFKDATTFFSQGRVPNLAAVIPAIDHIDAHLTTISRDEEKFSQPIRIACGLAKETLNKYYSLTDNSISYRIAMVLHPRHKLSYFRKMKWSDQWITTARQIVSKEYATNYASRFNAIKADKDVPAHEMSDEEEDEGNNIEPEEQDDDEDDEDDPFLGKPDEPEPSETASATSGNSDFDEDDTENIFEHLETLGPLKPNEVSDELARYLSSDPEDVSDPIQWWCDRRAQYPNLSRMAIDFLTIPATSVPVEHLFSIGRLLLPYIRNRMQGQTTRALLCLKSWTQACLVKQTDAKKAAQMSDVEGDGSDVEMDEGWDRIDLEDSD
ncbi:Zinc finger BED domain-containing protein RICESLEEPER 3 [Trametes pubescens]|uniref:Zinc finger BED domain-containing protein RICESLEEPER 3 n=1 Tax=Trametes pubescens TaxID=154538 RepID=A0A1M2W6N0_TRAPU|nr:Zinc finger BED domain-containing protein RICESLEEPER 3 [Trametes pubescens]